MDTHTRPGALFGPRKWSVMKQVVKIIWHKAASQPQTDGSIVFAMWCQWALPWGHIGATWRLRLNLCFLWPKRQIYRFSRFCTAHRRKSLYFTIGAPLLQNCSFPRGIWTPSNSWFLGWVRAHNSNTITIGSALFAQVTAECHYTLQWAAPSPP